MIKKILFILFLSVITVSFSQEKTLEGLSAAPNPFTNFTNISYTTNSASKITLSVKNVLGKNVFNKVYASKNGKNTIPFYKDNLSSGVYIYSIKSDDKIVSKRLVIK
ncbi:T9SS type A sorting domain-containing protein [uncultured Polaribacter sp.]|uniref:T9SS type A sorting domain-containing protein n=1 Tax=uncultured Polaribacter sp. TaxID=174711 RepID=UPI00260E2783|nr:T9SS type A sorting domain-containing protein [uncultured Polaribacter sp.]